MTRIFFILTIVFVISGCHGQAQHVMHHGKTAGPDNRTELKLPDKMKTMQKAMMREHLGTIGEITEALANGELKKAAELAKENLGWTPEEGKRCENVAKMTGEPEFLTLGTAVHKKADELSEHASKGDRDKALLTLSQLITSCNDCHNKFRH